MDCGARTHVHSRCSAVKGEGGQCLYQNSQCVSVEICSWKKSVPGAPAPLGESEMPLRATVPAPPAEPAGAALRMPGTFWRDRKSAQLGTQRNL